MFTTQLIPLSLTEFPDETSSDDELLWPCLGCCMTLNCIVSEFFSAFWVGLELDAIVKLLVNIGFELGG
jgi:hypothetical protein